MGCGRRAYGRSYTQSISLVVRGIGGGFSHTSTSPWRCTSARALPGFDSRCRMREACAYSTGSAATASYDGMRITLRSRSAFFTRRTKRTTFSAPAGSGALAHAGAAVAEGAPRAAEPPLLALPLLAVAPAVIA